MVRAEDTVSSLQARINDLENALSANKQANEQHIEELNTALRREKLERAVVEGALETGRKDFSRLMREVMAMQRSQQEAEEPANPRAANAACYLVSRGACTPPGESPAVLFLGSESREKGIDLPQGETASGGPRWAP